MAYVDGVLCAVPTASKQAYLEYAELIAGIFKRYGADSVVDNWGDDVPGGEVNSMSSAVMCRQDETVVFAWIVWPSKELRNAAWDKIMEDPEMKNAAMPFDGSRMIFGGFEQIMSA